MTAEELISELVEGIYHGTRSRKPRGTRGDTVDIVWYDGAYPAPMGEGVIREGPKWLTDHDHYGWHAVIGVKKDHSDNNAGRSYLGKKIVCIYSVGGNEMNPAGWYPSSMNYSYWKFNIG